MYTETSTDEINMIIASWFLREKKKPTRVEIYQKSVMEMPIVCASPQNKKKGFFKFQTRKLSRITLLKFSNIGNTRFSIRNLDFA